jgi:hypothetical protein
MKYFHRTEIFICGSIKENDKIYKKIMSCLYFNKEDKEACKLIDSQQLLSKIKDPKYKKLRFACISKKTSSIIPDRLFDRGIPILLFNLGNADCLNEFCTMQRIDEMHLKRMVYEIDCPHEIRGAINWVHTYYYYLRFKELKQIKDQYNRASQDVDSVITKGVID